MSPYVELHCKSNFSFLEGASHAHELVDRALELGYGGLAVTDRDTLAGIVRAHTAAKDSNLPFIVGCELNPIDGPPVVVWPRDRAGYGDLCRLLSLGRMRATKGFCDLSWHDIASHCQRWLAGLIPRLPNIELSHELRRRASSRILSQEEVPTGPYERVASDPMPIEVTVMPASPWCSAGVDFDPLEDKPWSLWLNQFRELMGERGYLLCHLNAGADDAGKLHRFNYLSGITSVGLLAAGDVLYHHPERMLLQDCLSAIATGTTLDEVARFRPRNATHALKSLEFIRHQYRECPVAIENTSRVASQIDFSLDSLRYEYPREWSPEGMSPIEYLKQLTWAGAKERYPKGVPVRIVEMLKHEIRLIEDLGYEPYFLTVWDLVRFARSKGILCQGRGSAANSAVCYCLGVTSVDPKEYDLLFERFISRERNEAPDIDIDFEHQRREEVIQYVYEKYGRHRAGMTAAVTTYRTRSAVRECAKAIGLSQDHIDGLAKIIEGRGGNESLATRCQQVGVDPESEVGKRFLYLVDSLRGFPRHLSQHTGGMVMTEGALCELCPIENAAMPGRTIIQWDKDDLDELGILKVDCLALGMLSAIHRSLDLIEHHYQRPLTLATIPAADSKVYDMICAADTVGVFQIESRAQMSMLPRLRPRCFYDLVIEVAIVRPGPIQGNMVHPYLTARRTGIQPEYPNEEIASVLRKTMGVPIFQEQAMRLAVVAEGFTPGEADQLRRAMAAWRRPGVIDQFKRKLIEGMRTNGLDDAFAERVFNQIRGFGEYGFPESHAASFALLVYASCWIKHHYPNVFCCALLNSQPLGFYAPAQLISDAARHGVEVLPIDINQSQWDCTLESSSEQLGAPKSGEAWLGWSLRLGLRLVRGLAQLDAERLVSERSKDGLFRDQSDLVRRCGLQQSILSILADCGALNSLSRDRRSAYWQALSQEASQVDMPLLAAVDADMDEPLPEFLNRMHPMEEVIADYETTGVSLRGHPMQFFRSELTKQGVVTASELPALRDGQFVRVAGLILLRQRPGTAKGITFVTMEDETGSINLVLHPSTWESHYLICKRSNAWRVHGTLENRQGVIHVVVGRIEDLSSIVGPVDIRSRDFR
ncbi:MAG: error-prone DNA polymerase [Pirellula sp.]|nr:error-prone DNA polymerase [Pirellula sp.]